MAGPILLFADEAEEIHGWLAGRHPEERFLAVSDPAGLDAALAEAPEAMFVISSSRFARADYRKAMETPSLRWVQTGGSGYENLAPWDVERITLTNGVGVLAPYLAETAMGAMLMLNAGLLRYHDRQRDRAWDPAPFPPLAGQTLLVVGAGAIGREVAMRARAFGVRTIGLSRDGAPRAPFDETGRVADIDRHLPRADIVSCHLRLNAETAGIFDARRFGLMKPGALFLNSARGGHVEEPALLAALGSGHIRGAWLDVFATEPLPADSPLWDAPNLLVTPHSADGIEGWPFRFAAFFSDNLRRFRAGEPLANRVEAP
jgi:phosphoglycerate dehydrogenase-like enzyme